MRSINVNPIDKVDTHSVEQFRIRSIMLEFLDRRISKERVRRSVSSLSSMIFGRFDIFYYIFPRR